MSTGGNSLMVNIKSIEINFEDENSETTFPVDTFAKAEDIFREKQKRILAYPKKVLENIENTWDVHHIITTLKKKRDRWDNKWSELYGDREELDDGEVWDPWFDDENNKWKITLNTEDEWRDLVETHGGRHFCRMIWYLKLMVQDATGWYADLRPEGCVFEDDLKDAEFPDGKVYLYLLGDKFDLNIPLNIDVVLGDVDVMAWMRITYPKKILEDEVEIDLAVSVHLDLFEEDIVSFEEQFKSTLERKIQDYENLVEEAEEHERNATIFGVYWSKPSYDEAVYILNNCQIADKPMKEDFEP